MRNNSSLASILKRRLVRYPRPWWGSQLLHKVKVWQLISTLAIVIPVVLGLVQLRDRFNEATTPNLSGGWTLYMKVNQARKNAYKEMLLRFSLHLQQDKFGNIKGGGELQEENKKSVPFQSHRPITVDGQLTGEKVSLRFEFNGAKRPTCGTITLWLRGNPQSINGTFLWDASDSSGEATIRKVARLAQPSLSR